MKKVRLIRRLILLLIVFSVFLILGYIYFFSPQAYQFSTYEYVHKNISSNLNGFKIAFLSDFNLCDQKSVERLDNIVTELNEYTFDMVIIGGDLYDDKIFNAKDVSAILKKIDCKYGKFAILGEKDQEASLEVTQIFNNGGFEVLENTVRTIYYKNDSFLLYACDQDFDISTLKGETKTIKVAITHQPDSFISHKGQIDLQLSGHSYGGSLYLPYFGAMLPPDDAKTYNHGVYEDASSTLLVSNGISGPSSFPYKFLAKNEINFVVLSSNSHIK